MTEILQWTFIYHASLLPQRTNSAQCSLDYLGVPQITWSISALLHLYSQGITNKSDSFAPPLQYCGSYGNRIINLLQIEQLSWP